MTPADIIRKKRDGETLTPEEIDFLVRGFVAGEVAAYQMSAFLMAVYLQDMTPEETAALTRSMVESGEILSFPEIPGKKVDKHSTGGVGDLVSLPLAPIVASAGVPVPMISGRGLGHTGGTLDKLESIHGLRTRLDPEEFRSVLAEVGFVMGGQSETLAPADRKMYALRDVTATVESIPLIVSSILSKKVAEGIDALVLDVKCGRGAFMKNEGNALRLARELCRVGTLMGKEVVAFVTDMDTPLGTAIGNAVEVRTALDCLQGRGPADTMELTTVLAAAMICLGDKAYRWDEGVSVAQSEVQSGRAMHRFRAMVAAQGGDVAMVDDPERLPRAPVRRAVTARRSGILSDVDPLVLGRTVLALGGGRTRAEDDVDPSVGLLLARRRGDRVEAGDLLVEVLAADARSGERASATLEAEGFRIGDEAPARSPLVRYLVTAGGETPWRGAETWDRRG